jgi:hypothetical protein
MSLPDYVQLPTYKPEPVLNRTVARADAANGSLPAAIALAAYNPRSVAEREFVTKFAPELVAAAKLLYMMQPEPSSAEIKDAAALWFRELGR